MITDVEYNLIKIVKKATEKVCSSPRIGRSYQYGPFTVFIYDFNKILFHKRERIKLIVRENKVYAYKRQATGNYIDAGCLTYKGDKVTYLKLLKYLRKVVK